MRRNPIKQPKVPDALIDALEVVLARLWEGERLDYHYGDDLGEPDRQTTSSLTSKSSATGWTTSRRSAGAGRSPLDGQKRPDALPRSEHHGVPTVLFPPATDAAKAAVPFLSTLVIFAPSPPFDALGPVTF